jgi:CRP/FNR family transcriptional regulator, cyclic AMP receptor protein
MFLKDKVSEVEYQPGDYIIREGAQCDSLIVVKSGQIEIFKVGKNNSHITLGLVQSGEYLGEMSLITDRPHFANAVALTKTVCLKIPNSVIEEHMRQLPSWLVALTRGLVYKLDKTNDVLRRNGIVDETLNTAVKAITEREDSNKEKKTA